MIQLPILHLISAHLRALTYDRRANTAVEFALAAPALFLFMFGIIEVGYALWMQNALDYSVAAAARCASLSTSQSSGNSPCAPVGGNSQVTTYAAGESGASLDNTAFVYTSNAACGCRVTGNYTIALDIPWENALSVNLSSSACIAPPPNKNCAS
jgi:Flp pilus assembly protein TadG